tara:strand:- start:44 stop:910 length:867 start_codon:yes stop_codon:yes gene_type:complete
MIKLFRRLTITNGLLVLLVSNVYASDCDIDAFYSELMSDSGNYEKVIELAIPCTEYPDPFLAEFAQTMVGDYYLYEGEEFTRDKEKLEKAFMLYKKAAEQGNEFALYQLGIMYQEGLHVGKDILMAKNYFEESAELGNADAQVQLGIIYGDPGFINTFFGTLTLDYEKAMYWFKKAAKNEYPNAVAAYNVHVMYLNGWGTNKNPSVAEEWLKLSAELGDLDAIDEWNKIVAEKRLSCAALKYRTASDSAVADLFLGALDEKSNVEKDRAEKKRQKEIAKCDEFYVNVN